MDVLSYDVSNNPDPEDPDCHTPILGPTRLADPNRVRSARLRTETLYLIFFFQSLTCTCGYGPHLITYIDAHAFRLNHDKHITETDIKIFMNSYNPIV